MKKCQWSALNLKVIYVLLIAQIVSGVSTQEIKNVHKVCARCLSDSANIRALEDETGADPVCIIVIWHEGEVTHYHMYRCRQDVACQCPAMILKSKDRECIDEDCSPDETMNSKQRNLLRSFSFDLGPKKSAAGSSEAVGKSSASPERRERWKKIKMFSQGARVTSRSPPSLAESTTRQTPFDTATLDTATSTRTSSPAPRMADFLSRESELLGSDFGPTTSALSGGVDDIDLDRAASAFPDIGLDGSGDIPTPAPNFSGGIQDSSSFDSFLEPRDLVHDVKVTGDDEIERFEDQFPDIGGSTEVCDLLVSIP